MEKPTVCSPFFGTFLLTAFLVRQRMSMYSYLFTVAIPENYTSEFLDYCYFIQSRTEGKVSKIWLNFHFSFCRTRRYPALYLLPACIHHCLLHGACATGCILRGAHILTDSLSIQPALPRLRRNSQRQNLQTRCRRQVRNVLYGFSKLVACKHKVFMNVATSSLWDICWVHL